MAEYRPLKDQLEPRASATINPLDVMVQGSIAISLKRIADTLERWDARGSLLVTKRGG